MNEMTLEGFINLYESEHGQESQIMLIEVQKEGSPAPELIINPRANFEDKMEYYKTAYSSLLELKNNPSIKIIYYDFFANINDLTEYLNVTLK